MLKNMILAAILVVAFPVLSSAWTFQLGVTNNTAGINAGNKVTVTVGSTVTDVATGTRYFYPSSTITSVSVAIVNIDNVTSITLDGAPLPLTTPVVVEKGAATSHYLSIVYSSTVIAKRDVTVTQAEGGLTSLHLGSSSVTTTGFTSVPVGTSLDVVAQPNSGYKLTSLKINGLEKVTDAASGWGSTSPITKSFQVDASFIPNSVTAVYEINPNIVAVLSAPVTAVVGSPVQASVSTSSNVSPLNFTFSTTCSSQSQDGPSSTFIFTPTAEGTCSVSVTVTGPGASTDVSASLTVVSATETGNYVCLSCHAGSTPQVISLYDGSPHAGVKTCQDCHTDTPHVGLPSRNVCATCHADSSGNIPRHPLPIGTNTCVACHDPHSAKGISLTPATAAHYNNVTSGMYPASYMTSRATCMDCHYDDSATTNVNATIRQQWARSGHADTIASPWIETDFKTKSGCVQCHTTTGFIAYSTGKMKASWGDAADKTKEVLTCVGCHKDITTGDLRTVPALRPYADDSYTNRNVGESNICMACHSGTNNGQSITAKLTTIPPGDFTNLPFVEPHYQAAGGTLHGKGGYHFPGQTYSFYSSNTHRAAGIGNYYGTGSSGPCVACHKNADSGHTFKTQAVGLCAKCHGPYLTAESLNADKLDFANALVVLKAELTVKGHHASERSPYFTDTNWGTDQAGADTMGAAYNYALLMAEPAAYVHNSAYSKQLIFDSIDYLYNGRITGDISSAVASLVDSGAISQQAADNLSAYKAKTSCTPCHNAGVTGSHPAHLNDGISCADCHNATAATSTTLLPGTVMHFNGVVDVVIGSANNGGGSANFNRTSGTCSSVTCHGGQIIWGSGLQTCESCHTGALSVINGATATDKSLATVSGHGKPGIGLQCINCHDRSQRHLGGTGMLQSFLTGAQNTECNYCHSTFATVPNCPDCSGRSACASCHDLHGTTNLSQIRTSILGRPISFTDLTFSFVDNVTNQGFCQVCHTRTTRYRAGVPETNHYTGNCLTCHSPGAANKNGVCDSCHGYPPAPRNQAASFGTMNNWSSARFESYSGGGGAHLVAKHVSPAAKPSEGWVNCTMCHNGGKPYHKMVTPVSRHIDNVRVEIDPAYRFDNSFTVYTGARQVNPPARNVTGSCFNISCHMSQSPRWSTER